MRALKQASFHQFGPHAIAYFFALAGLAEPVPVAPSELVAPKIEIGDGLVQITIEPSVTGRIYQLQASDDLTDPSWQDLEDAVTGNGNSLSITTALDPGSPRRFFRLKLIDEVIGTFSLIPAGAFTMGRTSGDTDSDAPPVTVNVSAFYMGKYEVTKAQWDEVRIWGSTNGYTDLRTGAGEASNQPVHTISWFDTVKWCNARSQKDGLTPVYTVSGTVMKTGSTAPVVDWSANGYRLPTEAEWEKAARGGVTGKRFPWSTDTISHNQANFRNNGSEIYQSGTIGYHPTYATGSFPYMSPVGSFAANVYGLHDVAGNVGEWCWDWYGPSTYVNGATDPRGATSGSGRVLRGGSWRDNANECRVGGRNGGTGPLGFNSGIGFRLARSLAQ